MEKTGLLSPDLMVIFGKVLLFKQNGQATLANELTEKIAELEKIIKAKKQFKDLIFRKKERLLQDTEEIGLLMGRQNFTLQEIIYWCSKHTSLTDFFSSLTNRLLKQKGYDDLDELMSYWYQTINSMLRRKICRRLKEILAEKKISPEQLEKLNQIFTTKI